MVRFSENIRIVQQEENFARRNKSGEAKNESQSWKISITAKIIFNGSG